MLKYPEYLSELISFLRKMPNIGFKTAEKIAFELLDWSENDLQTFAQSIQSIFKKKSYCSSCFHLKNDDSAPCSFCDTERNSDLCIVATIKDVFSLERSKVFKGHYFVLGSLLSPIAGNNIDPERLQTLKQQIYKLQPKEIILALDATLEGDATALFLKKELINNKSVISRLALGIPMGVSFEYVDAGTLNRAFSGRYVYQTIEK